MTFECKMSAIPIRIPLITTFVITRTAQFASLGISGYIIGIYPSIPVLGNGLMWCEGQFLIPAFWACATTIGAAGGFTYRIVVGSGGGIHLLLVVVGVGNIVTVR